MPTPKKKNTRKTQKQIPTSSLGRAGRLLGAGLSLIGKEVAVRAMDAVTKLADDDRLQKRLSQAATLVDTLSQMKGAAMKTGQLLSLEFSDLLPPEVTDILRKLHDDAVTLPYENIEKVLRKELGPEGFARLKNISHEPISAASIGQVHTATVDGKKVAVKVQFPGVDKTIGADLALTRKAIESVLWISNRDIPLEGFFEECERVLRQEVDYRKEAKFLGQFAELVGDDQSFAVPAVYEDLSTKRVLVLSFMEGEKLKDWMKQPLSDVARERFTGLVLTLLFKEFFEWGLVQTDPNYGNFLFRPDEFQLVLLDFGATNSYSKKSRKQIRDLQRATMSRDYNGLLEVAAEAGILDPRESDEVKQDFSAMMELIVGVFRPENQPFDFSSSEYLANIRTTTLGFAAKVRYTSPAKDLIFLNRKLGGMFHLLKDLGATYDLSKFWDVIDSAEL
jgi:predicted unusual protein kinase regulating ubiquinone biosynthesis (AarF/ABC1/UbiB family)